MLRGIGLYGRNGAVDCRCDGTVQRDLEDVTFNICIDNVDLVDARQLHQLLGVLRHDRIGGKNTLTISGTNSWYFAKASSNFNGGSGGSGGVLRLSGDGCRRRQSAGRSSLLTQ